MRVNTLLSGATALLLTVANANILGGLTGASQRPLGALEEPDVFPVPGDNPLFFCEDPAKDILTIDSVDLDPNPPAAGQKLSITARGTLAEEVADGAHVRLQVKYGVLQIVNQQVSLCDYAGEIGKKCPLKDGELELVKDVELPAQIPPGKYTVLADATTKDGERITCLTATVVFSRQ